MANVFTNLLNRFIPNKLNQAILSVVGGGYVPYDYTLSILLEKGYKQNPDVFAVVNQMATKTANVPFCVKKIKDEKAKKAIELILKSTNYNTDFKQKKVIEQLKTKAYDEEEMDLPLKRPNPLQTWGELFALYKTFLKVTGNAYFYLLSPENGMNKGVPIQIYILPADLVQIVLKKDANLYGVESPIDYYMIYNSNNYIKFYPNEIIHIKKPNPFFDMQGSHLYGHSELYAALRNIQSSNLAIDNNNKMMANSGVFGFIHGKGPNPLTPEQATQIKERLTQMHASTDSLSNIAGSSGELGFTRISLTADELKPFDFLSFDRKTICNVLIWSDELLNNDSGSTLGSGERDKQASKRAITDNIMPDLKLLQDALTDGFVRKFKGYENAVWEFDPSELPEMQEDMTELVAWLEKAPISKNEFRQAIKYETRTEPEMDKIYIPMNIMPIDGDDISEDDLNGTS